MSFISVIARENFVTVMSDGRVRNNTEIVEEDYKKFTLLTPNLFFAFAGHAEPAEALLTAFESEGASGLFPRLKFEQVNFLIKSLVESTISKSPYKALIAFGGKNETGEIEVYFVNSSDMQCGHYLPKGDTINVICLGNREGTGSMLEQYFRTTGSSTPQQVLAAQKMMNDHIADLDTSVNKNTFELIIMK